MAIDRDDWLIPLALIALAAIPIFSGSMRLGMLANGGPVTPESLRFFAAPATVVVHIVSATIYSILGAFQFSPGLRRHRPNWHRISGRLLIVCGLAAALSGLWMALTFDFVPADTAILHFFRLFFGVAMVVALVAGFVAIRRRNIPRHQAWMRRGYAIGLVVGTQAALLLPLQLLGQTDDFSRTIVMGAGWILNLGAAEWLIRRKRRPRSPAAITGGT